MSRYGDQHIVSREQWMSRYGDQHIVSRVQWIFTYEDQYRQLVVPEHNKCTEAWLPKRECLSRR